MKTIKDIMVISPKYCGKHETLQAVAEQMAKSDIRALPVVDENKKLVGIITDRDVCLTAASHGKQQLSELKVQDAIVNRKVFTITPEDSLQSALRTMRTQQVGQLPVVDKEQKLQGYVTLNHIVRTTAEAEVEYSGEENVIKTLHSLANRELEMAF